MLTNWIPQASLAALSDGFVVAVRLEAKPGEADAVAEILRILTAPSMAEPGMKLFLPYRSPTNPALFHIFELYVDEAGWKAHQDSAHFKAVVDGLVAKVARRERVPFVPFLPAKAFGAPPSEAHSQLLDLNRHYVRSVQEADVPWFEAHLAPEFMNTNPDGTLVDRAGFLVQIAKGSPVRQLREHDVQIRDFGDFAIVRARTAFLKPDGSSGAGRYTDDWHKRGGVWRCVSAHVTRA